MSARATTKGLEEFTPAIEVDLPGVAQFWVYDGNYSDSNEDRAAIFANNCLKRAVGAFVAELYAQNFRIGRRDER